MRDEMLRQRLQHALDAELSGLNVSENQRQQLFEHAIGGTKVKKKLTVGMVFAIVLVLLTVTALALALLSPREVVEQVAVPLAQQNDSDWRINTEFSPEELSAFIQAANENGIDLDENHAIMEAIRNGQGYDEEEAIMAVCRAAFGGNYGEWTIAERHWFQEMMVAIGFSSEVTEALPGPDDLTEEEARERIFAAIRSEYGEELPLEDRALYQLIVEFLPVPAEDGTVWTAICSPKDEASEAFYTVFLSKEGDVLDIHSVSYGRTPEADRAYAFSLTKEEAVHLAAEGIRSQTGADTPFEDEAKYHYAAWQQTQDPLSWQVSFISQTSEWGFCSARVEDATGAVTVLQADVDAMTADNILSRYRAQYGWYDEWSTDIWADVAAKAAALPAETMAGRVVKSTPWIAWHEGLLTREQAEEQAFRRTGVRVGDVNCVSLIDAAPHPIWKFRLLPYDDSYQDSIVVEIDAVSGEMTDLDMYKSDYQELEPKESGWLPKKIRSCKASLVVCVS